MNDVAEQFFAALDCLDPLDAGYPVAIKRARKEWSATGSAQLSRLLNRLAESLDFRNIRPKTYDDSRTLMNHRTIADLCLEAICMIDQHPTVMPQAVRDCLKLRDFSLTAQAMRFVRRLDALDEDTRQCIHAVAKDSRESIGNRLRAFWLLRRSCNRYPCQK